MMLDADRFIKRTISNINIILSINNPNEGAAGCFDRPDECNKIYKRIISRLNLVTDNDIGILNYMRLKIPF